MSYDYLFKYIIIGDTGNKLVYFKSLSFFNLQSKTLIIIIIIIGFSFINFVLFEGLMINQHNNDARRSREIMLAIAVHGQEVSARS